MTTWKKGDSDPTLGSRTFGGLPCYAVSTVGRFCTCGGSGRVADPSTAHLPAGHPATDDVACSTCDGA